MPVDEAVLQQRRRGAVAHVVAEGSKASGAALVVLATAHVALTRWAPRYRALNSYVKRIGFACGVVGAFWFTAQLAAGRNVQGDMMRDAEAVELEDDAHRRAMEARLGRGRGAPPPAAAPPQRDLQ